MSVRLLSPDAMVAHGAAWADLAARALEPSIFNDPAFALPAARHLGGWRGPRVLTAWDPREPARLIGLCCVQAPVPGLPLTAWLHPQATAAFPLLDTERAAEAFAALLAAARRPSGPAGLLLHGLPADGATLRLVAENASSLRVAERSRAVLRPGDPLGIGRGAKEMRRQARRLAEQGVVETTSASDEGAVADALTAFLALEGRGWKGRRGTALGQSPRLRGFVTEMTAALAAEGRCRIDQLTLDGDPIAMGLILRSGPHAFFWKTAFDERYARFSPGAHLAEIIGRHQQAEPGVALTDSCAIPGHAMIDRLWPGRMTVVDVLVAPTLMPTRALRVALSVERTRRGLRAWIKGRLARQPTRPR